jgi:hypothetical protein
MQTRAHACVTGDVTYRVREHTPGAHGHRVDGPYTEGVLVVRQQTLHHVAQLHAHTLLAICMGQMQHDGEHTGGMMVLLATIPGSV